VLNIVLLYYLELQTIDIIKNLVLIIGQSFLQSGYFVQ